MKWEKTLKSVFDQIDVELENEYGDQWPLHPSRPKRGRTSSPEHDGLFNVGAAFSSGIGSKYGPGYTVEIRISTLRNVSAETRKKIKHQVFKSLQEKLPEAFPNKLIQASEDTGGIIRIHGDLSLND